MRALLVAVTLTLAGCGSAATESPGTSPGPDTGGTSAAATPGNATDPGDAGSNTGRERPSTTYRAVQPGAPGESSRELDADELAAMTVPGHSPADTRFMQGMIPHHAQAIEMVALMEGRTTNPQMLRLGGRIRISQFDEIAFMQRWLRERGEAVPQVRPDGTRELDAAGHSAMGLMPGMLTPEQMDQLAAAGGDAFDRLFLELMIGHHQGAITMVEELFSTPGGGQESWTYQFAADVDADQTMEITRMRQMMEAIPGDPGSRRQ